MSAPLLLCDTPGLLYRGFFALPDSIKGAEGRPALVALATDPLTLSPTMRLGGADDRS